MKSIIIFIATLFWVTNAIAQPIFSEAESDKGRLTAQESRFFERLDSLNAAVEYTIVRVSDALSLLNAEMLTIPIKGDSQTFYRKTSTPKRRTIHDKESFRWIGSADKDSRFAYLFYYDGYLNGMIHWDHQVFEIKTINREYVVFVEIDQSKFGTCLVVDEQNTDTKTQKTVTDNTVVQEILTDPVIDVLVVWTNNVENENINQEQLAEAAIDGANMTFSNSDVYTELNLVHSSHVDFSEMSSVFPLSLNFIVSLEFLANDLIMGVEDMRNEYGADVVVLLLERGGNGNCGLAEAIEATSSTAYAVVAIDCINGNYTFAHEIGHLIGGRHDNDTNVEPREYAHGYRYGSALWRTIMAVPHDEDDVVIRIPYWSNPYKSYGGVAMGNTSWNDVARVWNERASTVEDFKFPWGPKQQVYITGNLIAYEGTSEMYTANISSGGTPPFSYQWYYRDEGEMYWTAVGTNSQYYTHTIGNPDMEHLRVDVTGTYWPAQSAVVDVIIFGLGKIVATSDEVDESKPTDYVLEQNYPNPFNPSTIIGYQLPDPAQVTMKVFDIMGRLVDIQDNGFRGAGRYETSFNGLGLASGLYIVRLQAVATSGSVIYRDMKMQLIK